ncbi:MAG: NAD(P)/FAD-dependent oxidoreductase [Planctomycetota bacterium]
MRIAVVGTGISGMVAAWMLCDDHDLVIYEANDYVGGHTHTVDVDLDGGSWAVDTGFIVFNEKTYSNFVKLLRRLGVAWQPSTMSFSVRCDRTGLEYCPSSLNSFFAQRRNLLRPSFYRLVLDILRFRRESQRLLATEDWETTLGDYLAAEGYSRRFIDEFIVPMGAAIWSADPERFRQMPARFFAQFFYNHAFLNVQQPQWLTVRGGSRTYVAELTKPYQDRIRLASPVHRVERFPDRVEVTAEGGEPELFDAVVLATHTDQALDLLADPSDAEHAILGAIPYQPNDTVLHTDTALLPRLRRVWAAWNYIIPRQPQDRVAVTYDMNILQSLDAPETFCVSLNCPDAVDPAKTLRRLVYHHPVYTPAGIAAQKRRDEINGVNRTYFCGAYWSYGFHEDGVRSALAVAEHFGKAL